MTTPNRVVMHSNLKKFLRFGLCWGVPPLFAIAGCAAGYWTFFPGLEGSGFSDGSARSFEETAERIRDGNLLEKASPLERVAWLLEICKQPRSIKRDSTLFAAIQQMQPGDFMAAIADLPELAKQLGSMDGQLRTEVIQACIDRWMDVDEEGLMRWLPVARGVLDSDTWKLPKIGKEDLGAIYGVLAKRKPGWMFEQVQALGSKMEREAAIRSLMQSAVEGGLPQAEAWLASFKGQPEYLPARRTYLRSLAKSDPERALTLALAEPTGSPNFAIELITECGQRRPDLATAMLDKLGDEQRLAALKKLAGVIATNPDYDAFRWIDDQIERTPQLLEGNNIDTGFLKGLAQRDAPKTMAWIQSLPEAKREWMTCEVVRVWMDTEPKALLGWLNANPGVGGLEKVDYFGKLPKADPEGFQKWIATLPPGEVQRNAKFDLAQQLLEGGKVAEAVRTFPTSANDTRDDSSRISAGAFAFRVAIADPQEGTRLIEKLPPGQARERAVSGVINLWLHRAPLEATAWVEGLPPGDLRDQSAAAIVRNVTDKDFDGANAWLGEIQSQTIRDQAATHVFNGWRDRRPTDIREWLRSVPGVSETVRNRLLRK